MSVRQAQAVAALLLLAGCRSVTAPPPTAALSIVDQERTRAVLWAGTAAERDALCLQAFRWARIQLDRALADPTWSASAETTATPLPAPVALITDIDETLLSTAGLDAAALLHRLEPTTKPLPVLPGAQEFLHYARSRGVRVFYITNRGVDEAESTRRNLQASGLPLEEGTETILLRGARPEWDTPDKGPRRAFVAQGHRVLLLLGDDLNDFVMARTDRQARQAALAAHEAWIGERWIVLPNPVYGSWEGALWGHRPGVTDEQKREAKQRALEQVP